MAPLSKREKRRRSAQLGQRRAMAGRQCPQCGRGNALTRDRWEHEGRVAWLGRHCRYCDYARGDWL